MYKVRGGGRKENEGGDSASSGRGFGSRKEMADHKSHVKNTFANFAAHSQTLMFLFKLLTQEFAYSVILKLGHHFQSSADNGPPCFFGNASYLPFVTLRMIYASI